LVQVALLFLATVIVARKLGPLGRAQYALPLAAAWVASALAHLSLGPSALRQMSRGKATLQELSQHLSAAMVTLSLPAAAATIGYCLLARGAVANASFATIVLCAATVPFTVAAEVSGQLLLAIGETKMWTWASILGVVAQLCALAACITLTSLTPASAMAVALVGFVAVAILMLIALARRAGVSALRPRWTHAVGRPLLAAALRFHPGTLALQLGPRIDLLIVGGLATARATGLYSLAVTLGGSAYVGTRTLTLAAVHDQMQDSLDDALAFTAMFTRQAVVLALVTCALISAAAYPFITIVYGSAWRGSVLPFVILLVAAVAMALEEPVRQMLVRVGRPITTSLAAWSGVALNAAATVAMFIPLGIVGAALGSVVAFWVYALIMVGLLTSASRIQVSDLVGLPRRGDPVADFVGGRVRRLRGRVWGSLRELP
jgi:O-antigen/teichoic acid export membrane protein